MIVVLCVDHIGDDNEKVLIMTCARIPKYVATPEYCDEFISLFGAGDTPEEAFKNFTAQPILDYAQESGIAGGEEIEVTIWTAGTPGEAGWDDDEVNPDWKWCLVKKVGTKTVVLEQVFAGGDMKDKQLKVAVEDGVFSISIGVNTLCHASEVGRRYGLESVKITDKGLFLKEMVRQLERESEDGATPVHAMFDNAVSQMLEDGENGVDLVVE
ncbi:MAG: hypothetical protein ACPGF7_05985 [Pontibacterium sp.]